MPYARNIYEERTAPNRSAHITAASWHTAYNFFRALPTGASELYYRKWQMSTSDRLSSSLGTPSAHGVCA